MLKLGAVVGSLVILFAVAFIAVPKLLLKASGTSEHPINRNVPVGAARGATPATSATRGPARRTEAFTDMARQVGFTPLTPSSLPAGYQPWEQYVRTTSVNEVVLTYFREPDFYILISERKDVPGYLRDLLSGDLTPAPGSRAPYARNPVIDIGGARGFYLGGRYGPANRAFGPDSDLPYHNNEPHAVEFIRGDLLVLVEADIVDVSRDQLIQIAAGLR